MSVTYPDLTNDFPDVESDERYLYRDVTVDDITYINQYETLLSAVKTASDDSGRQTAWEALVTFKETDDYKNHVEPVMMTALKLQTLEDKTISAQRFAKRQTQQWNLSDTEPEKNTQAVGDIWLRNDGINEGVTDVTPFYKGTDGEYHEMGFSSSSELKEEINNIQQNLTTIEQNLSGLKFQIVEILPESPDPETLYIITKK